MQGGIGIKNLFKLSIILVIALNLTACSFNSSKDKPVAVSEQEFNQKVENYTEAKQVKKIPSIQEILNTLCSEEFEGRSVGSKGNTKSEEYIAKFFKDIELEPLFDKDYYNQYSHQVFDTSDNNSNSKPKEIKLNNIAGVIKGKDNTKAVVLSAHFDHVGYENGKLIRGALDNASGVSALLDMANTLKQKSKDSLFNMDVIICAFNGEETGLQGSKAFVKNIKPLYKNLYNINMDCVGGKESGKISLHNKSKVSAKLNEAMRTTFKKDNLDFSNIELKGATSDHRRFEDVGIPNVYIGQEKIKEFVHKPTDTPDKIDCNQLKKLSDTICDFIRTNDGIVFNH